MGYLIIWLEFGVVSAMIASSKGNSGCGWVSIGDMLGPIGLFNGIFYLR